MALKAQPEKVYLQFPEEVCSSQTKPVGKKKRNDVLYSSVLRVLLTSLFKKLFST